MVFCVSHVFYASRVVAIVPLFYTLALTSAHVLVLRLSRHLCWRETFRFGCEQLLSLAILVSLLVAFLSSASLLSWIHVSVV